MKIDNSQKYTMFCFGKTSPIELKRIHTFFHHVSQQALLDAKYNELDRETS